MNHQAARDAAANLAYPVDGKGGDWKATHPAVYIAPPSPQPRWTVVQCAEMLDVEVSGVEDWRTVAACRNSSPSLFFLDRGEVTTHAVTICTACPSRAECLAFALNNSEMVGIWGGLSDRQRRNLRQGRPFTVPRHKAVPKMMPAVAPPSKRTTEIVHGSPAGYHQHMRRDERPCPECRSAYNKAEYQRRKARGLRA